MKRDGLTLLETMVALVILGLVVLGYLELFAAATRTTHSAELWAQAVVYAEDTMELIKIDPRASVSAGRAPLPGGFERQVERRLWAAGLDRVTVTVYLPDGGRFALDRLVASP